MTSKYVKHSLSWYMEHIKTYLIIHNLAVCVPPPLFSSCTQGQIARSAVSHIKSSRGNGSLVAASFKKYGTPSTKIKQLQALSIYWETCALHHTKTKSLYPAGLLSLCDHKLLYVHTYMSFQCIGSMWVCVCVCPSVSLSACSHVFMSALACLPQCVFYKQTCMQGAHTCLYPAGLYAALIPLTLYKLPENVPLISLWCRFYLWVSGKRRNCFHVFGGDQHSTMLTSFVPHREKIG